MYWNRKKYCCIKKPSYLTFFLMLFLLAACNEGPSVEEQILAETKNWLGTPYKWGGTTPQGVDCSGFTWAVFDRQFDINLPRKAEDQEQLGFKVSRETLEAGDLVFFKTGGFLGFFTSHHVGIYLSAGKFAHASKSQGVTISSMDEPFWREDYLTSRRIMDEARQLVRLAQN